MLTPMRQVILLSIFFVAVFSTAFFTLQYSLSSEKKVLELTNKLTQLQIQYVLKNEQVTNDFKRQNYDKLNSLQKQFLQNWKIFSDDIEKTFYDNPTILQEIKNINSSIEEEKALYLKYESNKAILTNSVFFLAQYEADGKNQESHSSNNYTHLVNEVLHNVVYFQATPKELKKDVDNFMEFTQKDSTTYTHSKLIEQHIKVFYSKYLNINRNIQDIKDLNNFQKLKNLEKTFFNIVQNERYTRDSINIFVAFLAFVMLVGFLISYYKTYGDKIKILNLKEENDIKQEELLEKVQLLNEYKRALDESSIISKTDLHGKITYVNDKFIEISGYKEDELIGQSHNIVRHPEMEKEFFENMWKTLKEQKVFHGIIKNLSKSGNTYYVESTVLPIIDHRGKTTEYFAVRNDVTNLVNAKEEALAAERTKSAFLATMSHELRTPLNAVIGFSNILMIKKDIAQNTLLDYLEKINVAGKHLLNTINNILDFSKIESNQMDLTLVETDINLLVNEVITLVETDAHDKDIHIITTLQETTNLQVDPQLFKQVVLNILSNAVKFTPNNKKITISEKTKKGFHILCICDEGLGLTQEQIVTLFDPFSQIKAHQKSTIKGTGLGLAISQKIMQLHKGFIEVESEVDLGSCFNIYLPVDGGHEQT